MCMQDWRIARLVRPRLLINNATAGTIGPNQQRVGIAFSTLDGGPAIGTEELRFSDGITSDPWYYHDLSFPPRVLSVQEFGSLITNKIAFTETNGGTGMNIWELTMPEEWLTAALEDFNSQYKIKSPYEQQR